MRSLTDEEERILVVSMTEETVCIRCELPYEANTNERDMPVVV